jgi:hypothetical protein
MSFFLVYGLRRFSGDSHLDMGVFFEFHILAMFVSQHVLDPEVPISVVGPSNGNLRLLSL